VWGIFIPTIFFFQADDVSDKDLVYSSTTIADWILPAIYMGHVGSVVWVKPPWAEQMPEGQHTLVVGKEMSSGHIRYKGR